MVADDNVAFRLGIARILSQEGYKVMAAGDGQAAYDIVRQERGCLSAVLTDVNMPRMSGAELVARILVEYPELKILCMSAYPSPALPIGSDFIAKPFTPSAFLAKVRDLLSDDLLSPS